MTFESGKIAVAACIFLASGASAAIAQDLHSIDDGIFKSADLNSDGKISRSEIINFSDLVFLSADSDGDEALSKEEFLTWDPGYIALAEQSGKIEQWNRAKSEIYSLRDLNKDGVVTHDEFSVTALYDFYTADTDSNRSLSQGEFVNEYRILASVRASLS